MSTPSSPFEATATLEGTTAEIMLSGIIDGEANSALAAAYATAEQLDPSEIRLNFAQVDYINSTGIALIVGLLARARTAHLPLTAVGLSDHYREIFTITRLSDFIQIQ